VNFTDGVINPCAKYMLRLPLYIIAKWFVQNDSKLTHWVWSSTCSRTCLSYLPPGLFLHLFWNCVLLRRTRTSYTI